MSETATIRHLDLRRGEPTAPHTELVYDIFWWGDVPVGARASARGELPLGASQLCSLAAHFLARQLAGRDPILGAPLVAGSEGRPHAALRLEDAATLDRVEERLEALTALTPCDASDVALIICTRDRPQALQRCLTSLRHQLSQPGQLIVVDNSARGSGKAICSGLSGIDYVHEPTPGLSRARNAGIRAAGRSILAFTDDDVEPHPAWLSEVSRAFREHDVECVTGLVLPATLGTQAQRSFQFAMGAFGSNFIPLLFDRRFFAETRPHGAHVWRIGAGANMAFRRDAFERAGLFDERLGAGASGCSEDSEFWYRLLALGGSCLYEPRAVVLHHHRSEWRELSSQVRVYMRGHVSALVAQYDAFGDRGNLRRIGLQLPHHFARVGIGALVHGRWDRLKLLVAEIRGWFAGLTYLVRPGWRRRRGRWQKL